jgi:hypothetical protein
MSRNKDENLDFFWRKISPKWIFLIGAAVFLIAICAFFAINDAPDQNEQLALDDSSETEGASRAGSGTDGCIDCHDQSNVLEAITLDWEKSEHARNNITCIDCHEAAQSDPDAIFHNNVYMSPVVSPKDCAECHPDEVAENDQSLHSFGAIYYELLYNKQKLPYLESQVEGGYISVYEQDMIHAATLRGCQSCHGTNMTGTSVDDFTVWPNNGIGRINPDGSKGSCSACHSRHSFSVEEARKPETCGQCHMGPDHPHIEIYLESKHGNIYMSEGDTWNWTADDWEAGVDYRAPTCSACHMSAAPGVPATHDVSSRLSWELESAISKRTDNTANSLGTPISDGSTWQEKQGRMKKVCGQCHSETWVDNFYEQADLVVKLYNEQYTEAKLIVDQLYDEGLLTSTGFDEPIEFKIYEMWHHEGRRARMGAFMMGPDYVQWHGFYEMLQDKVEIEHMAGELRNQSMENGERSMVFLATSGHDNKVILKWNISHPSEVDHYEIYWDTSLITDVTSLTPQVTTTDDFALVEDLASDTTYYFTILAVDSEGDQTGIAFSSAMSTELDDDDDDHDDNDEDDTYPALMWFTILLVVIIIIILMVMMMILKTKAQPQEDLKTKPQKEIKKKPKRKKK